ncbi:hypothetical protein [Haladaptatus sp. NG-SE-30]
MASQKDDTEQSDTNCSKPPEERDATAYVPPDGYGLQPDRRRFLTSIGGVGTFASVSAFSQPASGRSPRGVVGSSQNPTSNAKKPDAAYSATDLGTLGGAESTATGINRRGSVVGVSQRDDLIQHAFLWSKKDGMQDLGTLTDDTVRSVNTPRSTATDINGRSQVVGASRVTDIWDTQFGTQLEVYPNHAIRWSKREGMRDIRPTGESSEATANNDRGDIVGNNHYFGEDDTEAFIWSEKEGARSIEFGPGTMTHHAEDVNNSRQVAVTTWDFLDGDPERAVIWTEDEGPRELGTLGGPNSSASGVNDSGLVVGDSSASEGYRAFIWSDDEGMRSLGTLGGNVSRATAINNRCQVVGTSQTADGTRHAFIWSEDEGMRDLGTLGGNYSYATDINERGQVVGYSRTADGYPRATLWEP